MMTMASQMPSIWDESRHKSGALDIWCEHGDSDSHVDSDSDVGSEVNFPERTICQRDLVSLLVHDKSSDACSISSCSTSSQQVPRDGDNSDFDFSSSDSESDSEDSIQLFPSRSLCMHRLPLLHASLKCT